MKKKMKTEISKVEEILEVETKFGQITETKDGKFLSIGNGDYRVSFYFDEKKHANVVRIEYTIHRPCHDHNNAPSIELELPNEGVIMCDCGSHKETNAKLSIKSDSDYLHLHVFLDGKKMKQ